ncbi:uncharacterized protein TM35_000302140 [Trypanosoma theileri]|uniref:Secreted protein n=1 Tax=Trypanosoma theileri TaxID=67003 RepID=A0A1X0NN89_9TRYP|nr:uncharacterized protein TM35_000302140 [Trypanosoma theileri]ORC86174.1 hypothetical protein TM35_000302140 [Trypanosoma theileri]
MVLLVVFWSFRHLSSAPAVLGCFFQPFLSHSALRMRFSHFCIYHRGLVKHLGYLSCGSWTYTFAFSCALKLSSTNCVPVHCFWWYNGDYFSSNIAHSKLKNARVSSKACENSSFYGIA